MTEFSIPNIFTAGTKAKAYEVNENFAAIKTAINNNVDSITANTQSLASLEDYVDGDFKDELENLIESVAKTRFCVNSAHNPILAINSSDSSILDFNVDDGTTYEPIVATPASGAAFERTSIPDLDVSGYNNGTYNIFAGAAGNAEGYINSIYRQKNEPAPKVAFTQPVLSANGTLGGSAFACAASGNIGDAYPFKTLDGSYPGVGWHSANGSSWWLEIYNPLALNITNFQIRNSNDALHKAITAGNVQGSNDGTNWTTITTWTNSNITVNSTWNISLSSNTTYYKYYLINITSSAYSGYAVISEIALTASVGIAVENDIWLDTSVEPLKSYKYDGSAWAEYNKVPIGSAIVVNGAITAVENFPYNQNGYNVNVQTLENEKETLQKWNMPDLTTGVSKTADTTYSAEKNQWIYARSSGSNFTVYLYVNGVAVVEHYCSSNTADTKTNWYPVYKGQKYYCTSNNGYSMTIKTYDFIGGN